MRTLLLPPFVLAIMLFLPFLVLFIAVHFRFRHRDRPVQLSGRDRVEQFVGVVAALSVFTAALFVADTPAADSHRNALAAVAALAVGAALQLGTGAAFMKWTHNRPLLLSPCCALTMFITLASAVLPRLCEPSHRGRPYRFVLGCIATTFVVRAASYWLNKRRWKWTGLSANKPALDRHKWLGLMFAPPVVGHVDFTPVTWLGAILLITCAVILLSGIFLTKWPERAQVKLWCLFGLTFKAKDAARAANSRKVKLILHTYLVITLLAALILHILIKLRY
jgi:hypothetical protein